MIDHVSIECANVEVAASFYDEVLATLGAARLIDRGDVIGYGRDGRPTFWLGPLEAGMSERPIHLAFAAADREQVDAFFAAALARGATPLHEPREWPEYHERYYGAFVRDPDGNNVEAVCHH